MLNYISKIYSRQVSSKGLGLFRIVFFINFFLEIFRIFKYRHLYYDDIPFLNESILSQYFIWFVWLFIILLIIIGYRTRVFATINYLFFVAFIINNSPYEYHMDYIYVMVFFLSIIVPTNTSYSIDNLLLRIKYSTKSNLFLPKEITSKSYYYLLFLFGVAIVYFDSAIMKSNSVAWTNGLGLWLPASIPQITIYNNQWHLNQEFLIKFLGYFTLVFEMALLFIFWFKKLRIPIFLIGVFFHVGIIIQFPIPFFGMGVIALYFLLIPLAFWNKLENLIAFKQPKLYFFYDEECPLCLRTKIIVTFFDIFKAVKFNGVQSFAHAEEKLKGYTEDELLENIYSVDKKGNVRSGVDTYFKVFQYIPFFYAFMLFRLPLLYQLSKSIYGYIAKNRSVERCTFDSCSIPSNQSNIYKDANDLKVLKNLTVLDFKKRGILVMLCVLVLFQINVTFPVNFPASDFIMNRLDSNSKVYKGILELNRLKDYSRKFSHMFFGITKHGVFLDNHYSGFNSIYTLSYNGELLPLYNDKGQPDRYQKGGVWANYNFRVNGPGVVFGTGKLQKGLIRYSAFYIGEQSKDFSNATFKILKKNVVADFNWRKDLLNENLALQWQEVGELKWENNKPTLIKY